MDRKIFEVLHQLENVDDFVAMEDIENILADGIPDYDSDNTVSISSDVIELEVDDREIGYMADFSDEIAALPFDINEAKMDYELLVREGKIQAKDNRGWLFRWIGYIISNPEVRAAKPVRQKAYDWWKSIRPTIGWIKIGRKVLGYKDFGYERVKKKSEKTNKEYYVLQVKDTDLLKERMEELLKWLETIYSGEKYARKRMFTRNRSIRNLGKLLRSVLGISVRRPRAFAHAVKDAIKTGVLDNAKGSEGAKLYLFLASVRRMKMGKNWAEEAAKIFGVKDKTEAMKIIKEKLGLSETPTSYKDAYEKHFLYNLYPRILKAMGNTQEQIDNTIKRFLKAMGMTPKEIDDTIKNMKKGKITYETARKVVEYFLKEKRPDDKTRDEMKKEFRGLRKTLGLPIPKKDGNEPGKEEGEEEKGEEKTVSPKGKRGRKNKEETSPTSYFIPVEFISAADDEYEFEDEYPLVAYDITEIEKPIVYNFVERNPIAQELEDLGVGTIKINIKEMATTGVISFISFWTAKNLTNFISNWLSARVARVSPEAESGMRPFIKGGSQIAAGVALWMIAPWLDRQFRVKFPVSFELAFKFVGALLGVEGVAMIFRGGKPLLGVSADVNETAENILKRIGLIADIPINDRLEDEYLTEEEKEVVENAKEEVVEDVRDESESGVDWITELYDFAKESYSPFGEQKPNLIDLYRGVDEVLENFDLNDVK